MALAERALLLPLVGASAPSGQFAQEPSVDTAAFFAAFEPVRVLTLEENEEVITVFPLIGAGRAGELVPKQA